MLAIALQCSPFDEFLALALVELLVEIEPSKRRDIEFILATRRGTNPATIEQILALARTRFAEVHHIAGKRHGTGWPDGCNDLWAELQMGIVRLTKARKLLSSGVLSFEPDCIPLRPDWLDVLDREWQRASAEGVKVLGHLHHFEPKPGTVAPPPHINGNAIFWSQLAKQYPQLYTAGIAWDVEHRDLLTKLGRDTPYITQLYRLNDPQPVEFFRAIRKDGQIPALFHGIKNLSGIEAVRAMLADGSFHDRLLGSAHTQGPA